MVLKNIKVTVIELTDDAGVVQTDQGQSISFPRHLVSDMKIGDSLYLAADSKPLVAADQHAKDTLNELINSPSS